MCLHTYGCLLIYCKYVPPKRYSTTGNYSQCVARLGSGQVNGVGVDDAESEKPLPRSTWKYSRPHELLKEREEEEEEEKGGKNWRKDRSHKLYRPPLSLSLEHPTSRRTWLIRCIRTEKTKVWRMSWMSSRSAASSMVAHTSDPSRRISGILRVREYLPSWLFCNTAKVFCLKLDREL